LDRCYGHAVLKLLNAQHYLEHEQDFDLVILLASALRWMVPDGPAAVWSVDAPVSAGAEWNDWLAEEVRRRLIKYTEVHLAAAAAHPGSGQFNIERFTRVAPFRIADWSSPANSPAVSFVWRSDRVWKGGGASGVREALRRSVRNRLGRRVTPVSLQTQSILAFAEGLRAVVPRISFSVIGIGDPGGLPAWIQDLRGISTTDDLERRWCRRAADSHVLVGVHGSHMLVPSAHCGAAIDLMPPGRWRNGTQDLLVREGTNRDVLLRNMMLPDTIGPSELTTIVADLLSNYVTKAKRLAPTLPGVLCLP